MEDLIDVHPGMPVAEAAAAYLNISKARGVQRAELAELEGVLREVQNQIADNRARGEKIEAELQEARERLKDGVNADSPVKAFRAGENRALITYEGKDGARTVLVELGVPDEDFTPPAPVEDPADTVVEDAAADAVIADAAADAPVVEEPLVIEEPAAEEPAVDALPGEEDIVIEEDGTETGTGA